MKLTRFSIDHAVTVYVLIAAVLVGGFFAYRQMPREAAPDIAIPVVIVSTPYFGVSPADMEKLVTRPMEREFQGLRDLETMSSTSTEGASLITLEFDPDVDIDEALQRVRSDVDSVQPDLPDDAEDPEIIEINASDWPVLVANVSGDMDPLRLQNLAEDLEDDIEAQPGVLDASLAGGVTREIEVRLHPDKLQHHGVSANEVIAAIESENVNLPGGSLDIGSMSYIVRVAGEFEEVEPIEHIVVSTPADEPIHLRDVATVVDDFEQRETFSRLTTWEETADGTRTAQTRPNISMAVVKRAGTNIIDVAEDTKEIIADYEQRTGDDVQITVLNDMSDQIQSIVHSLENTLLTGMILVFVVLFLFMGGVRNGLFVASAVPLSMLISILVLSMMGITLNMVVLFALLLSLGMLVDNAVVVVENIYRFRSTGMELGEAALRGTSEVGWAIIAATATTVAAFFPMLFWPGTMGEFMGFLPLTVVITLLSSLFVALAINPTLCATLMKVDEEDEELEDESVPDLKLYRMYRSVLEWALNHRLVITGLTVAALAGTFWAYKHLNHGVEFFPETSPEQFTVEVTMPDGTNLEYTDDVLGTLEEPLEDGSDLVTAWVTDAGTKGGGQMGGGGQAAHFGQITVELKPVEEQESNPRSFMDRLRATYDRIPGPEVVIEQQEMGPPTGDPISIEIAGDDLEVLSEVSNEVQTRVRTVAGVTDLTDDLELTRPEIHVDIDRQSAAMAGLSTQSIARTVRTAIAGTEASVFREGEDEHDVMVRLDESSRQSPEDIRQLTVVDPDGEHIPIREVADVEIRGGSGSIQRKSQRRVVTVSGNVEEGYLAPVLLEQIREDLDDLEMPPGYDITYGGEQEEMDDAREFLIRALFAAVCLITLILVTEFNSIVQPVLILISVILSLIGVLWALVFTGMPFGVIMTGIGIISLSGVVVNNAIVMIDYINQLRQRGYDRREAVIRGGMVRFRPVALTAVTTMLGLVPMVLGISIDFVNFELSTGGTSVQMWQPMANAVVFGLLAATALTMVVVPVLYSLLDEISQFGKDKILSKIAAAGLVISLVLTAAPAIAQSDAGESVVIDEPVEQMERVDLDESIDGSDVEVDTERTLSLEEARRLVYDDHFDVRQAQTRVTAAEAQIRQATGTLIPSLTAGGTYTINQEERIAEMDPDVPGVDPVEFVVQPRTDYRWNLSATVSLEARAWPVLQGSRVRRDIAEAEVEAIREQLDQTVVDAYFNLLTIRRSVDLAVHQLESARRLYESTQTRLEAGTATEFELTRAELEMHRSRRDVDNTRLRYIQARQAMAELLQTEADFDVIRPRRPELPDRDDPLERAERNRAVFTVDEQSEEFAVWTRREVFSRYLPTLQATATYAGSRGTDLQPGEPQWTLTFSAEWLIWDGGIREGELDETRAEIVAAEIRSRQTRHELDADIEQAYTELEAARTELESARTEAELAGESYRQTRTARRHGVATQLEVIDARDQLRIAQLQVIRQRLQVDLAHHRLNLLVEGTLDQE